MENANQNHFLKRPPTKRAPDGGDSASFSIIFPWPSPPGQAGFEFFPAPKQNPRLLQRQ